MGAVERAVQRRAATRRLARVHRRPSPRGWWLGRRCRRPTLGVSCLRPGCMQACFQGRDSHAQARPCALFTNTPSLGRRVFVHCLLLDAGLDAHAEAGPCALCI